MIIKEIIEYDEAAQEADILVTDGQHEILCYAHPFINQDINKFMLEAFMTENVIKVEDKKDVSINKIDKGYYAYKICGRIIDIDKRLVSIGNIVIKIEDIIPKDIINNDFIEFSVLRVDFVELQS